MDNKKSINLNRKEKAIYLSGCTLVLIMCVFVIFNVISIIRDVRLGDKNELRVAMSYPTVQEGDNSTQSDNVKFDAYVLKDLNGDGKAEKIRGTCRAIGAQDLLYMEVNVTGGGTFKNGKIEINGKNFYLATALLKDNILQQNYISNNTRVINLNQINVTTNSIITGNIQSGDYSYPLTKASAIPEGNINNYSSNDNTITLSGVYVDENGNEKEVSKTVNLNVDWYGSINTELQKKTQTNELSEDNTSLTFDVVLNETKKELMLSKMYVEGELPKLNGYDPINVILPSGGTYDAETRKFVFEKSNNLDELGNISQIISSSNSMHIEAQYPRDAFVSEDDISSFVAEVPITAYYEGYNNLKVVDQITKSNVVKDNILIQCSQNLSEDAAYGVNAYISVNNISKKNAINAYNDNLEKEDDSYSAIWYLKRQKNTEGQPIVIKQTYQDSMDGNVISSIENEGIAFAGDIKQLLGEDGYINLYNDETNELIKSFNKDNWNLPYSYEQRVNRIRIETSNAVKTLDENNLGGLVIYNFKKINNTSLSNEISLEKLLSYKNIYTYCQFITDNKADFVKRAQYTDYNSDIEVSANNLDFSTLTESDLNLTIQAKNAVWKNGKFLVKFPEDLTKLDVNNIKISNSNVDVSNYRTYKQDGSTFLEIKTTNEEPLSYNIYIDSKVEFDPMAINKTSKIEVFASNPDYEIYSLSTRKEDKYNLSDTFDYVAYSSLNLNIMGQNNLITTENIIDSEGNILARPSEQVELDKSGLGTTRTIRVTLLNNYSSGTLENVNIVGKIPFKGNKYQISDVDMGSEFDTYMTNEGIKLPEELKGKAKVYYSEKETVNKDLSDTTNGWTETPSDFSKVKTYLIDLTNADVSAGKTFNFTYDIKLPDDVAYNKSTYATHSVYFNLTTDDGILPQEIETNKIGILVAKKLNLEFTKYEELSDDTVSDSIYNFTDGNNKTVATTDENGKITFENLYVEKEYILKEEKENPDYEKDSQTIRFTTYVENGELKIKILEGNTRNAESGITQDKAWAKIDVDTRVKYNLNLIKFEKGTDKQLPNVSYLFTGDGKSTTITTDQNGTVKLSRLLQDKEYTLKETYAMGYKEIEEEIKFKVTRENDELKLKVLSGTLRDDSRVVKNPGSIPNLVLNIENERMASYTFELTKLETNKDKSIPNVAFNLKGKWLGDNGIELTTNSNGIMRVELYDGVEYTLKETRAADGYVLNDKELKFIATKNKEGNWEFKVTQGSFKSDAVIEDGKIKVSFENDSLFTITKEDEDTGVLLKGVKFAIYQVTRNEDGSEVLSEAKDINDNVVGTEETIDGVKYRVLETDENGSITAQLKKGLYKAVEVKALEGYDISDIDRYTYYFGIGESSQGKSNINLEWENENIKENDIKQTSDGGYVGVHNNVITKYNSNFNVEWSDNIDSYNNFRKIEQLNDGGYIILSKSELVKLNYNHEKEWSKNLDGYNIFYSDFILTKDGNILLGIVNNSSSDKDFLSATYSSQDSYMCAMKIDLNGSELWKNEMDCNYDLAGVKVLEDNDGNYIIYNINKYNTNELCSVDIFKMDKDGNQIWGTVVSKLNWNNVTPKIVDSYIADDGGYILVGAVDEYVEYGIYGKGNNNGTPVTTGVIIKLDKNGNIIWMKENIDTYAFIGIDRLSNGNYILQSDEKIYVYSKEFDLLGEYKFENSMLPELTNQNPENKIRYVDYYDIKSNFITLGNDKILVAGGINESGNKTSLLRVTNEAMNVPEKQEIKVYNSLKEYNIITTADENGSISGQDDLIYETVKYGKDATKDIIATPNDGYAVEKIIVNGEEISFAENSDGTVTLPRFTNVREDKTVMATFIEKSRIGYVDIEYREVDTDKELLPSKEIRGQIGSSYVTSPELNIPGYSIVTDRIPENAVGQIGEERTKVIYYYEKQPVRITTHYYDIETNEKISQDVVEFKYANEEYTTHPLAIVPDKYVFDSYTQNKEGTVTGNEENNEIIVNYYYRAKEFSISTRCENEGGTITGGDKLVLEKVKYGNNSTKEIVITPDKLHDIESISINGQNYDFNINEDGSVKIGVFVDVRENKEVVAKFKDASSKVTVSYIDKNTNKKIAQDDVFEGVIGDEYITTAKDIEGYELVEEPSNKEGIMDSRNIQVIYYYSLITVDEPVNTPDEPPKEEVKDETPFTGDNMFILITIISICLITVILTNKKVKRGETNEK